MKKTKIITKITLFTIAFVLMLQAILLIDWTANSVCATSYIEPVTVTNSSFNNYPNTTTLDETPSGWTRLNNSGATAGVINVTNGNMSNYNLSTAENPGKNNDSLDNKILMINAKNKDNNLPKNIAYKSNSFTLNSYSYYKLSVLVYTQSGAKASVYLSKNSSNALSNEDFVSLEYFSTDSKWQLVELYLETGIDSMSGQIELILGSKDKTSINAVFFDEVKLSKITKAVYEDSTASDFVSIESLANYVNLLQNPNFEQELNYWSKIESSDSSGAYARVLDVTNKNSMESFDLDYLGQDNSLSTNNALVIYTTNDSAYGVESNDIVLQNHKLYKISVNVKVSEDIKGGAFVAIKENNDVLDFYSTQNLEVPKDFYSPVTKSLSITSNSNSKLTNNYTNISFYIKNHTLYDTSIKLQLWLGYRNGEEETLANGVAVFDSITIEEITNDKYNSATTSSNVAKVELNTLTNSNPSVTNGLFNTSEMDNLDNPYPTKAASWTVTNGSLTECVNGIINTNAQIYENNKSYYGGLDNPLNKDISINDVNNIYMMWNKSPSYQTLESPSFSVNSTSTSEISFELRTIDSKTNIYVVDSNNRVVYKDINVESSRWSTYTVLVKTDASNESLHLRIELGNKDNQVSGYALLDNVKVTKKTMTDAEYSNYINFNNTIDFTNGRFNLISDTKNENNMFESLAFTGKVEDGNSNSAYGGVIDGQNNEFNFENSEDNENILKNMLIIETTDKSTYSLTSNFQTSLTAGNYYKFTIYIKTRLNDVEVEEDEYYGAEFALNGLDKKLTGIMSNDEWTKYEIFVQTTNTVSVAPKFSLRSLSFETKGFAVFDNYSFENITESIYTNAMTEYGEDSPYALFIGNTDSPEEDEESNNNNGGNFDWLILPTLITALAIVIAVVGSLVRKIKFKKFTKRKENEYDRNKTLYRDVFRKEAEDLRNTKVKECKTQIEELQAQIKELEENNQKRIEEDRQSGKTLIDTKTQRSFKSYASKHTTLANKIEKLQQQIEDMSTDEYLLALQKKIISQKVKEDTLKKKNAK